MRRTPRWRWSPVLAAVMLATGPYVAEAWLGISVPGIGVAIRTLSVVTIATIVAWLFTQTLLGHGNTRPVTVRLALGTAVSLIGMVLAAPTVGLAGVVVASFVGACMSAVLLSRIDAEYGVSSRRAAVADRAGDGGVGGGWCRGGRPGGAD